MNHEGRHVGKLAGVWGRFGRRDGVVLKGLSSLVLRIGGMGVTFLLGVILARVLGPVEFGIYGLVTGGAAIVMMVALLGTPQLAVRELSVRSARGDWAGVKTLIAQFGSATLATSLALGVIAISIAWAVGEAVPIRLSYVFQGALIATLMVVTTLISAELRGLGFMFKGQVIDIAIRPAGVFVVALLLIVSGIPFEASEALSIQIVVGMILAFISFVWIRKALPVDARGVARAARVPWLNAALPLGAVDVLRQLDATYGMLLIAALASGTDLGMFRVALACVVVVAMPINILHILQAPIVSTLYDAGRIDELQQLLSKASASLVAVTLAIVLACWLIGRDAIILVFGAQYAGSWMPLFLLCVGQLCFAFFGMGPIVLAMCHGERQMIKIYLISVGLGMAAAAPLIMEFGATGAAAAPIVSLTTIGLLSWRYARRVIGVDLTFLPLLKRPAPIV